MNHLVLIDVSNVAHRTIHARPPREGRNDEPLRAAHGVIETALSVMRRQRGTHLMGALDNRRAELWRSKLWPEYKQRRVQPEMDIRAELDMAEQALGWIGAEALSYPEHEADDVIASLARAFDGMVTIVSGDKDLLQCCTRDGRVRVWLLGRNTHIDWEGCENLVGVDPVRLRTLKALAGDASDGIPGAPGIGDKTARELIAQFDGDLEAMIAARDTLSGRAAKGLNDEGAELARRAWTLVGLIDDLPVAAGAPWEPTPDCADLLRTIGLSDLAADLIPDAEPVGFADGQLGFSFAPED